MSRRAHSALAAVAALTTAACGNGVDRIAGLPRQLSVAEHALIDADNRFAFKLFAEINRQDTTGGNVFVSPLSVAMALGMALNGSAGSTREAIAHTLALEGLDMAAVNASYRDLIELLRELDPSVEFTIANSIWHHHAYRTRPDFVSTVSTYFDATVGALDFRSDTAAPVINAWVAQATRDRIDRIVPDPIPPDAVAYLINAIYFKGDWTYQFAKERTAKQPFYRPDGSVVEVDMMSYAAPSPVRFARVDGYEIVDLPYGGQAYSMTMVLPPESLGASAVARQLSQDEWNRWVAQLDSTERYLSMPKYTLEWGADLKDVLASLGMSDTFCPQSADLTAMLDNVGPGDLCFTEAKHKTFVRVDEQGTEAAAVTSVGTRVTSAPPTTIVNRPFLFAIRERYSGAILFLGKIVDPSAT